ncbi:TetR/AcrR family transcriptional regulator [Streptomyces sp. NBC_00859]|uniref:TetR/AcrR family transcriptional regulator n=1 Tax=Streptomyces sp. NBC_00859 TaxID=2903682 RepID=UPI003865C69A|nr:TetR/AcrR family transcriptional regulator [Streptomyces sp. NBC_00859]
MAESDAKTPRERYRVQVRTEIKQHAWEQIATAGTSALSLNAIAKRMGMSGPALYRYFAGRDDLITALVREAYRSLADTVREVSAASAPPAPSVASMPSGTPANSGPGGAAPVKSEPPVPGADTVVALAYALRGWALDDPHRYFLVYGTPIPGYHAPDDITAIASEIMEALLDACASLPSAGSPAPFATHLEGHREWAHGHPAPSAALHRALTLWTRLHGALSLELAGHFTGMGFDPAQYFEAELRDLLAP